MGIELRVLKAHIESINTAQLTLSQTKIVLFAALLCLVVVFKHGQSFAQSKAVRSRTFVVDVEFREVHFIVESLSQAKCIRST